MKVLLSWIREFVDVPASAEDIGRLMSVRGLALEGLEQRRPAPSERGEPTEGDVVMDFDVTANRPDCLSMIGVAREIATAYGLPLRVRSEGDGVSRRLDAAGAEAPALRTSEPGADAIPVTIEDPALCARYAAAVAEVTVGPSPAWMQSRLTACGVRPISNVVDITNYVLLELGHPMHAFDLDTLAGRAITVRRARAGEPLRTLDGKMRSLSSDVLVIADMKRAQAIGGVMGGADSEVGAATRQIVFEAAWFQPASVRSTSKKLGLRTEASIRFERGADLTAPARAMARACALLEQIGAGKAAGRIADAYPRPHTTTRVPLERRRISGLLGMEVPDAEVVRILTSLGFEATTSPREGGPSNRGAAHDSSDGRTRERHGWLVTVPGWRVDIHRPVDLIEEVGRHHGFEHLPATFPGVQQAPAPSDPRIARDRQVRTALLGMGFSEAITFAFIEGDAARPFLGPSPAPVVLANPLSEKFAVMRPSLLPGLIDAVSHNRRHGRRDVRLFEIGTRFSPAGESRGAGLAWTGLATPDHWTDARREADFFDLKGVVEQVAAVSLVTPSFCEAAAPYLVPGRAAGVVINGHVIGLFGQLDSALADRRDLPSGEAVYVAEINLDALTAEAPGDTLRATPLPKYPSVVRDVSILVDDALSAETVRVTIRSAAPTTLVQVREFDRYQGKGVADGKVSLSFRLTFQSPERTLTDEEVQAAMQTILETLRRELKAAQR